MSDQDKNKTDPTMIDPDRLPMPPLWCGDVDVRIDRHPKEGDWNRAVSMTGGATVIDEPGFGIAALLNTNTYRYADGHVDSYAELSLTSDEGRDLPLRFGYRAAACLALLQAAFEQDTGEPDKEQIDLLEDVIRSQAELIAKGAHRHAAQSD